MFLLCFQVILLLSLFGVAIASIVNLTYIANFQSADYLLCLIIGVITFIIVEGIRKPSPIRYSEPEEK